MPTLITILSAKEKREFEQPRRLTAEQRRLYFSADEEIAAEIARVRKPHNRLGFLLQLGYFKSSGQFFPPESFHLLDIKFCTDLLGFVDVSLDQYSSSVAARHRLKILALCNWSQCNHECTEILTIHARGLASNQENPKDILYSLIDICWKKRIEIPSIYILTEIITDAFNAFELDILDALKKCLTSEQVEKLDGLLEKEITAGNSIWRINGYKKINQSLRPRQIADSVHNCMYFRDLFLSFSTIYGHIALNDKATSYYAAWTRKAPSGQLHQFRNRTKARLHLLSFIKHQFFQRHDNLVDTMIKCVRTTHNAATKQVSIVDANKKFERDKAVASLTRSHKSAAQFFKDVKAVTATSGITPSEKFYKIEQLVFDYEGPHESDAAAIDWLNDQVASNRKNQPYYEALETLSRKLQHRVAPIVKSLVFDPASSNKALLSAIACFNDMNGKIGPNSPTEFLTLQERNAINQENGISKPLYKALLFVHIVNSIKSGALNLLHSYRYRALGDYLINLEEWRKNRTAILQTTGLDQFQDGQLALDNLKSTLDPLFHTVNKRYLHGDNSWIGPTYDNRHTVRTPKTDFDDTSSIAATLDAEGYIPVYQVLTEVNRITQFTKHFRHFSTKNVKMSPSSVGVLAGIIAKGCNISLSKLPYISNGLSEHRLRNAIRWRFDLENIRGANRRIVDAISSLSLAENYVAKAKFAHTSSDGHKINVAVDCLHANHSYKYFGKDKGVTHYTFIDEKQSLLYSRIFTASDREAPYVIDGLLSNNVSSGQIHSTDTHGYTEQIFGAAYFLNISFAPRLKKISHQRIYSFSTRRSYEKLNYPLLPSRKIDSNIILQQWEEILRFMATIKLQHASAAQLFKRMSSYARDHPLYKALKEFGRIIKSQFILTYYDDVELRQRIQKQLNRVELSNKFSRAVFFDNDQAFQDGDLEEQEIASACKVLIQNAVIFWNYLCLSEKVLMEEKRSNKAKLASKIAAGSVITWRHVNFRGEYDFRRSAGQGHQFNYSKIKTIKFNSLPR